MVKHTQTIRRQIAEVAKIKYDTEVTKITRTLLTKISGETFYGS